MERPEWFDEVIQWMKPPYSEEEALSHLETNNTLPKLETDTSQDLQFVIDYFYEQHPEYVGRNLETRTFYWNLDSFMGPQSFLYDVETGLPVVYLFEPY